jgi:hypothetical protein
MDLVRHAVAAGNFDRSIYDPAAVLHTLDRRVDVGDFISGGYFPAFSLISAVWPSTAICVPKGFEASANRWRI